MLFLDFIIVARFQKSIIWLRIKRILGAFLIAGDSCMLGLLKQIELFALRVFLGRATENEN